MPIDVVEDTLRLVDRIGMGLEGLDFGRVHWTGASKGVKPAAGAVTTMRSIPLVRPVSVHYSPSLRVRNALLV